MASSSLPGSEFKVEREPCKGSDASMAQSLSKLYVHLIFSTKNRERTLGEDIRPRAAPLQWRHSSRPRFSLP